MLSIQYFSITILSMSTKMMTLNEITFSLVELFKMKKITLHNIKPILQAFYYQLDKGSLTQRISIISTIAHFFQSAIKYELAAVQKFRSNVLYGVFQQSCKKQKRPPVTKKRVNRRQVQRGRADMTINEMVQEAVNEGLNQTNNSILVDLPKQDPPSNLNKNSVILPPFEPEIIALLNQEIEAAPKTPEKDVQIVEWKPNKLENYQKWLALSQNGLDLFKKEKLPRTKKRTFTKKQEVADTKIDVSQGVDSLALIEKLTTKIKISRISLQRQQKCFDSELSGLNTFLTNVDNLRQRLEQKVHKFKQNHVDSSFRHPHLGKMELFEDHELTYEKGASKPKQWMSSCVKNDDLGEKLNKILNQVLFTQRKTTFSKVWRSKTLNGVSKGEVFYHLLHLNFDLKQIDISHFGEIQIFVNLKC